jgi:hypothetical protein
MSSPSETTDRAPLVRVPDAVRHLLLRLLEGWLPAMFEPGAVSSLQVGSIDCTEMATTIENRDYRL